MPYVPRFWLVEIRQMESASNKAGQLWRMCCTLHKSFRCNGSLIGAQKRAMGWGWWWKHIHPRRSPKIEMRLTLRVVYSDATTLFLILLMYTNNENLQYFSLLAWLERLLYVHLAKHLKWTVNESFYWHFVMSFAIDNKNIMITSRSCNIYNSCRGIFSNRKKGFLNSPYRNMTMRSMLPNK